MNDRAERTERTRSGGTMSKRTARDRRDVGEESIMRFVPDDEVVLSRLLAPTAPRPEQPTGPQEVAS